MIGLKRWTLHTLLMFEMQNIKDPRHITSQSLAYVENRLPHVERLRVERHLRECALCHDDVEHIRATRSELLNVSRVIKQMPVSRLSGWGAIRQRLSSHVPQSSWSRAHLSSWQVSVSMILVMMLFASSFALNNARAATPNVPVIQTPAPSLIADTPTVPATRSLSTHTSHTPTLTLIPLPATARP